MAALLGLMLHQQKSHIVQYDSDFEILPKKNNQALWNSIIYIQKM